jgi:hypothetical protein
MQNEKLGSKGRYIRKLGALGLKMRSKQGAKKEDCIIRESNTGLVDGNDEFYH